jgi:hypothetical protein
MAREVVFVRMANNLFFKSFDGWSIRGEGTQFLIKLQLSVIKNIINKIPAISCLA